MGLWEFLIAVVAIEAIVKLARMKTLQSARAHENTARNEELIARMEKLERRMANLETIVLDTEKKREFERI